MAGSDPEKLISKADKLTKLSMTRWNADWQSATQLYEQAALGFRLAKNYWGAKAAFEKASKGQEMLSSPWDAAKHMESAAALAKELGKWSEVADFYRRASELYNECGRSQPASDAFAKGARALEDAQPDESIKLYTDACALLEEDGKENMAFDLYRAATNVYIKLKKYTDAATFLLRWGLAADKCNAQHSQCKVMLKKSNGFLNPALYPILITCALEDAQPDKSIKLYTDACALLEEDGKENMAFDLYRAATNVYIKSKSIQMLQLFFLRWGLAANKCNAQHSQCKDFLSSDQNRCASKLLSAYTEGDVEEIKRVAQLSTMSNLDHMIIRLARKLPTGDVSEMKTGAQEVQGDALDEDDLT